jgi:hypothetical protein
MLAELCFVMCCRLVSVACRDELSNATYDVEVALMVGQESALLAEVAAL